MDFQTYRLKDVYFTLRSMVRIISGPCGIFNINFAIALLATGGIGGNKEGAVPYPDLYTTSMFGTSYQLPSIAKNMK